MASAFRGDVRQFTIVEDDGHLLSIRYVNGDLGTLERRSLVKVRGRAFRLVRNADGTEPSRIPPHKPSPLGTNQTMRRSASDLVKIFKARGEPTPRAKQAAMLRSQGLPYATIAERMGVAATTVKRWCYEARSIARFAAEYQRRQA